MLPEQAPVPLVDDSADDRFPFRMCWTRAGIPNPVVEVEDGRRAIDYLSTARAPGVPSLVLLDLKMPVRNGARCSPGFVRARPAGE